MHVASIPLLDVYLAVHAGTCLLQADLLLVALTAAAICVCL